MTIARGFCKFSFIPRPGQALLAALAVALVLLGPAQSAGTGPEIWQDPATGLAMGGYDPLAYFTRGGPRTGSEDVELQWGGAIWRFLNTGNRAAFQRHPHAYVPRFAGYDPYALVHDRTTRGKPSIWFNHKDRIYLFHNNANLLSWQADSHALIAEAEKKWPALSQSLPSSLGQ